MDSFMDQLSEKLAAQEMIRANGQAETEAMEAVRVQVNEYKNCLDRMTNICQELGGIRDQMAALPDHQEEDSASREAIDALKSSLQSYQSTLVGFFDGTAVSNGGATATINAGDGKGIDQATNDAVEPNWGSSGGGSGSGSTIASAGKYVIGSSSEYFWFNEANTEAFNTYVTNKNLILSEGATFSATREITNSKIGSCSDYIGSVLLPVDGSLTAYWADGIVGADFYVSSNGSQKWILEKSADGTTWTTVSTVEGKTAGHPTCVVTANKDEAIKYVRITNKASGGRDVQGIKIATYDSDANGINTIATDKSVNSNTIFDLQGRQVKSPQPGKVYIQNGKKYISR